MSELDQFIDKYISIVLLLLFFIIYILVHLYKNSNSKKKYTYGVLLIFLIPTTMVSLLKNILLYMPGTMIGSIDGWLGFLGGYIGSLLALSGIWLEIKYNEIKQNKNFKNYIFEIINWNLNKITTDNLEIETLNLLTFSKDFITIKDLNLDELYLFSVDNFSEANSIMINLGIALDIQDLNLNISIYNKLVNNLKESEKDDDFFHSLSNKTTPKSKKIFFDLKIIDHIIRNYLHFLRTKKKFPELDRANENFSELCDSLNLNKASKTDSEKSLINQIIEYNSKEKDINFIYIMFDLMSIYLNNLSNYFGKKNFLRDLNIDGNYNNSDEFIYKFLRSKSNEIKVIKRLIPIIMKDLNKLKKEL